MKNETQPQWVSSSQRFGEMLEINWSNDKA